MRCGRRFQAGSALIVAILAMSLIAIVAVSVLESVGLSLEWAGGRSDQAQARLLARGAVDWARNVLANDRLHSSVDHGGEAWNVKVPPTPVNFDNAAGSDSAAEGEVGGEVQDLSGRFNVNNLLTAEGEPDAQSLDAFVRLLQTQGMSEDQARSMARALQARLASVPGSGMPLAGGPLIHAEQLQSIDGFDSSLAQRIQPLVAALPAPSAVNVNMAPAAVLAALVPGLSLDNAQVIVAGRDRAWFRNLGDFANSLPASLIPPDAARVAVLSRYFLVTGRARYGQAAVALEVLLDRGQAWPEILWERTP